MMMLYSVALAMGLILSAPWWIFPMLGTERYREGLGERLGHVPQALRDAVKGKRVVWLHAVSVGEVLAASRLVTELGEALGPAWIVVISTTTRTGQQLARERFSADRVFYMPLDFAWTVRRYLDALRPEVLVLMESELWPRLLDECQRRGVPTVVANARMSDRSFGRAMKFRRLWSPVLRKVSLFLAQSEQDTDRLRELGAPRVMVTGNLKFDARASRESTMAKRLNSLRRETRLIVAGSTLRGEEKLILEAWRQSLREVPDTTLLVAPRHPERFDEIKQMMRSSGIGWFPCSALLIDSEPIFPGTMLLLDTIGDLAAVYGIADLALVGGSIVPRGGHNPLEPAQFGVPVLMGPSYENFRDIVARMISANAIRIVRDTSQLSEAMITLMRDSAAAQEMGENGRNVYLSQQGGTKRTIDAILQQVQR